VAQRVAGLLEDGTDPEGIVAFTFTNRAAAELKQRINMNVWTRLKLAQKRRR
jgi:DNA helicase-2/ATP-dependent DNA helicase PcrA